MSKPKNFVGQRHLSSTWNLWDCERQPYNRNVKKQVGIQKIQDSLKFYRAMTKYINFWVILSS